MLEGIGSFRVHFFGNREAVYDYDNQAHYTYKDMAVRSDRLGGFLLEELRLTKGDRVAFVSENAIPFLDCFFMSYCSGIVMVTYNFLLGKSNLAQMVGREEPRVIFYSERCRELIEDLRETHPEIEFISIIGKRDARDRYDYDDIMDYRSSEDLEYDAPGFEDIQMLIHTGGTTGEPKAAMLSYRALFFNMISQILTCEITSKDSALVVLPFFHTAGWNISMMPTLLTGGRVIITTTFDSEKTLRIIREEKPTLMLGVETIYLALAAHSDFSRTDFSSFRWLVSGAAPIKKRTLQRYWEKGVWLLNGYGMTEIGPSNMTQPIYEMTPEQIRKKWNSVGKPMFFNNVRIVDDDGVDVPTGESGELLFRGWLTFSGYWRSDEQTEDIVRDGWVYTGDIARKDKDGFYYIIGRRKNVYISGGENIYPAEIESVIDRHPDVAIVCVIGVPDEDWGEVGKALIVLKPNRTVSKEEIRQFATERLPCIKVPRYVSFIEELPKNSIDKVDLQIVNQLYRNTGE
jgi:fatty-acyl-CoA synthase